MNLYQEKYHQELNKNPKEAIKIYGEIKSLKVEKELKTFLDAVEVANDVD